MREIKFRAWNKDDKRMFIVEKITFEEDDLIFVMNMYNMPKEFELMQYTGFKDKNGKEIYEEDIIYLNDGYEKAVVKFGKYTRRIDFYDHRNGQSILLGSGIYDNYGFYLEKYYSFDGKLECLPITYIELHSSEIKGNIQENLELLNDTK